MTSPTYNSPINRNDFRRVHPYRRLQRKFYSTEILFWLSQTYTQRVHGIVGIAAQQWIDVWSISFQLDNVECGWNAGITPRHCDEQFVFIVRHPEGNINVWIVKHRVSRVCKHVSHEWSKSKSAVIVLTYYCGQWKSARGGESMIESAADKPADNLIDRCKQTVEPMSKASPSLHVQSMITCSSLCVFSCLVHSPLKLFRWKVDRAVIASTENMFLASP